MQAKSTITRIPVPSETVPNLTYLVGVDAGSDTLTCTCPDFRYRGHRRPCKHIAQVAARLRSQTRPAVQRTQVSDAGRALAAAMEV